MVKYFVILLLLLSVGAQAADWETVAEMGLGFDDNVTQSPSGEGSGFTSYGLDLAGRVPVDEDRLLFSGFLYGRYQQLWSAGDNYLVGIGTELAAPLMGGILSPELAVDGTIFTDREEPEDDRDEIRVEGRLRWYAGGRLTVLLRQSWAKQFYDEAVVAHRGGPHGKGNGNGGGKGPGSSEELERRDELWFTGLALSTFFSPAWSAEISGNYARDTSTIETESYDETGIYLGITWRPSPSWEVRAGSGWWKVDFDHTDGFDSRTDHRVDAGAGVSWIHSSWELFWDIDWEHNDSTWETETYHNSVTRCGVLWHF